MRIDRVLSAAVEAGIPYVDITRWTSRVARAATLAGQKSPSAPVYLSSGWMGGVTNIVAAALAEELGGASTIDRGLAHSFSGAVLEAGTYDVSAQTPAGRTISDEYFIEAYVGHVDDRSMPKISVRAQHPQE